MKIKRFANSLVTRLVLFGVFVVVASAIVRYNILVNFLEGDQAQIAAEQQSTIAGYLAQDIGYRVQERRHFLERLAKQVPPALLDDPAGMLEWLKEHHELQPIFARGLFVANSDGLILLDYPTISGRRALSLKPYADDYRQVLDGATVIGEPILSPASKDAILGMLAPLKDASGKVAGILGASTELNAPGFLNHLQQATLGPSGSFLLVSPARRLVIAANDPALIFQPLPAAGADSLLDSAMQGYRGNGIGPNADGVSEIKAFASVPGTHWFVVVRQPLAQAIPTVDRMRTLIGRGSLIQGGGIFLLVVLAYVWFFRPLRRAAALADKMTRGEIPLSPLPVVRRDEVGHLTMAFNGLLARLKLHQSELQHQAHHDMLTGLPNRIMLADRMREALARADRLKSGIAVLFLDLDGFKPINDKLGHKAGDQVLQEVARRLRQVARRSDTLARVGGDEFVLLATDLGAPLENGARALAEKCIEAIAAPLWLASAEFHLGVSVGIAVCDGSCNADSLLQAADKAMYDAKAGGRGCYVIAPPGVGCAHVPVNAPAGTEETNRPAGSAHS